MKEYDVIIVGGGVTGASTARDCAIRGLSTLLIERGDICDGASGRNHGLLHSGARYAVTDMEGARECIQENLILKRIARNCIDSVGGLFITLPEDGTDYRDNFISRCNEAGIETRLLSANEALELEPSLNPRLVSAVQVPDASVDPFHLTDVNIIDALRHGAQVLKFHRVTEFIVENGRVAGVKTEVRGVPAPREFRARMVVLAAGIWTAELAASVGIKINMLPSKGSLIIFGHRVSRMVVNRCRKPSNADILVPGGVVSVLGTTSDRVPMEEVDSICATPDEVDLLVREGAMLVPSLANTRVI
ncbi:MAG: anaerobic glycerol-3-phosphate dehydrogenase subunit A, partial [Bacteroidales bacterium]|nr:anaerobic glycerol-3-phosphate dehydrogenase subunit A [Bacteroidales bacterium]